MNPCGSIHLAHRDDEWAVLEEFASAAPGLGYTCELLTPEEVLRRTAAANPDGLKAGCSARPSLASIRARQSVHCPDGSRVASTSGSSSQRRSRASNPAARVALTAARGPSTGRSSAAVPISKRSFPAIFHRAGLARCKLQMLKTTPQPEGFTIGPHLASGLTLRHYANFAVSASLPALKRRIAAETPELDQYGIHVMASQNDAGEADPRRLARVRLGHRALRQGRDRRPDPARARPRDPPAELARLPSAGTGSTRRTARDPSSKPSRCLASTSAPGPVARA